MGWSSKYFYEKIWKVAINLDPIAVRSANVIPKDDLLSIKTNMDHQNGGGWFRWFSWSFLRVQQPVFEGVSQTNHWDIAPQLPSVASANHPGKTVRSWCGLVGETGKLGGAQSFFDFWIFSPFVGSLAHRTSDGVVLLTAEMHNNLGCITILR